jgi:HEPN domain-containing protein
MSNSLQLEGEKLIRQGDRVLQRDVKGALDEQDFNMTVRRAQEAVELALKGGLKMLGVDYPKVHDVAPVFSEQAQRKLGIAEQDMLRSN